MLRMGYGHDTALNLEPFGWSVCPGAAECPKDRGGARDVARPGFEPIQGERMRLCADCKRSDGGR